MSLIMVEVIATANRHRLFCLVNIKISAPRLDHSGVRFQQIAGLCDYFIVDVYHCCPVPVCLDHKVFEYRVLLVLIEPTLDTNEL